MNKKLIVMFMLISLSVTSGIILSGCKAKNNTQNNTPTNISTPTNSPDQISGSNTGQNGAYKDGVYDIQHKSTKPGYEEAVVTIKNGKIDSIDLKRLDDNKVEVNYNDWDGTKGGRPNLKQARIDLATAMINKQSPNVDAISGATQSSNGWIAAVTDALAQAQQ